MTVAARTRKPWAITLGRLGQVHTTDDAVLAAVLSVFIAITYVAVAPPRGLHWFLAPTLACGILIGPDMVAWLRGRLDAFDPIGVVGGYGYYFFFVAPLLTVYSDYHTRGVPVPSDWNTWIGWGAVLNLFGLVIYRSTRALLGRHSRTAELREVHPRRLGMVAALALPITFATGAYTLLEFGGLSGLMDAYSARAQGTFAGMGTRFLVGDSFPNLLMATVLFWKRQWLRRSPWWTLAFLVVAFFGLRLVFGGLRGSRSNTVWALIWLAGAIHLWVRPITRRAFMVAAASIFVFMYVYGFYKAQGRAVLERINSASDIAEASSSTGRTLTSTLLGDFSRTEIQAILIHRIWEDPNYRLGLGETYLDAAMILLPSDLRESRPGGKIVKGTEAIFGTGSYVAQTSQASYVYGLAGEAMLNFHVVLAPLAFAVLAAAVVYVRKLRVRLHADDVRRVVYPIAVIGCVVLLTSDSDNLLVFLVRTGLVPLAFCWAASRYVRERPRRTQARGAA